MTSDQRAAISARMVGENNPQHGKPAWNKQAPAERSSCACGCGQLATAGRTYVTGHNTKGTRLSNFTGRYVDSGGYIRVWVGDHPYASDSFIAEHRLVVERSLHERSPFLVRLGDRTYLDPLLVVHHIDGNKTNNDLSNLQVMTRAQHTALHHKQGDIRP